MVIDKDRNENILTFWDSYYKRKISTFPNSAFSTYCLNYLNKESTLIDVGCGDGRDSLFFSRNHIYTTGIDFSSEVINQNKKFENDYLNFLNIDLNLIDKYNKKFDFAYCRFLFHAINEDVEDILLKWIAKNISSCIFIETRIYDEKTSHINQSHFRRYFTEQDFTEKIKRLGFTIKYSESSRTFSRYKDIYNVEDIKIDPLLLRIIISKEININNSY